MPLRKRKEEREMFVKLSMSEICRNVVLRNKVEKKRERKLKRNRRKVGGNGESDKTHSQYCISSPFCHNASTWIKTEFFLMYL